MRELLEGEVQRFSEALDAYPCAFVGNPLYLLFVEDAKPIASAETYLRALSSPHLLLEQREFLMSHCASWRFPAFQFSGRPDPKVLSDHLFQRFDQAQNLLLTQSGIGEHIERQVNEEDPDIVILVIADGLSYYDLPEGESRPCLVEGPSITQFGYRQVVGKPSLSQRLFSMGYRQQKAFTYFDPMSNPLAADLHRTFGDSQVVRVTEFSDILSDAAMQIPRGYLQVTTAGLDGLCHNHRDRPPVERYLADLLERFERLMEACKTKGRKVLGCLTADHGILWREELKGKEKLIDAATAQNSFHPRYLKGSLVRDYAKPTKGFEGATSLLKYPYLTRSLKRTEWGVHGGISAWESLVPFKMVT